MLYHQLYSSFAHSGWDLWDNNAVSLKCLAFCISLTGFFYSFYIVWILFIKEDFMVIYNCLHQCSLVIKGSNPD